MLCRYGKKHSTEQKNTVAKKRKSNLKVENLQLVSKSLTYTIYSGTI